MKEMTKMSNKKFIQMNLINKYVRETTKWDEVVEAYLNKLKLEGARPATLTNYSSVLKLFGDFIESELDDRYLNNADLIKHSEIEKFQYYMLNVRKNQPSTINQNIAKLHAVFAYCHKQKRILSHIATEGFVKVREDKLEKEILTEEDFRRCLNSLDRRTFLGARTHVVLTILNAMGLRISELVNSKVQHYDLKNRTLFIPVSKNRKSRSVPINDEAMEIIKFWLDVRKSLNPKTDFFLLSPDGTRVKQRMIQKTIKDCFVENGIYNQAAHSLRHKFVSDCVKRGVPIHVLSKVSGHSERILTEVYTHFTPEEIQKYF